MISRAVESWMKLTALKTIFNNQVKEKHCLNKTTGDWR